MLARLSRPCASLAVAAAASHGARRARAEGSRPFDADPALATIIAQRREHEAKLRAFLERDAGPRYAAAVRAADPRHNASASAADRRRLEDTRREIAARSEALLYPNAPPGYRDAYLRAHGCTKVTAAAADAIAALGRPVLELGAGAGHWAAALATRGVRVTALDDGSAVPLGGRDGASDVRARAAALAIAGATFEVKGGDAVEAARAAPRDLVLLLVYPPPGDMAARAVGAFRGRTLVYVGEARGGANGDGAFFDALEADFRVVAPSPLELEPFVGGAERLYVLERRAAATRLVRALGRAIRSPFRRATAN